MNNDWKRQLLDKWEDEGRTHLRKITGEAGARMRNHTGQAQRAAALADLQREQGADDVPDADDASVQRGMLT